MAKGTGLIERIVCALAYTGILFFLPLLLFKGKFSKFHANQGLALLVFYVVLAVLCWVIGILFTNLAATLWWIGGIIMTVLFVLGVVTSLLGMTFKFPIIGGLELIK